MDSEWILLYSVICMIVTRSCKDSACYSVVSLVRILFYSVICMIVTRSQSGKDSALFCYMYDCNP